MSQPSQNELFLFKKIEDENLLNSIYSIRNAVENFYLSSQHLVINYTDHGFNHCTRLIDYANKIIKQNTGRDLSSEESYLLLSGIYLHDIGMECDLYKLPNVKKIAEEKFNAKFNCSFSSDRRQGNSYTIDEQKDIRNNHHLLSAARIGYVAANVDNSKLGLSIKGIENKYISDLIDICRYHSKLSITDCPTDLLNRNGRKQLIASILRLSDELDKDSKRVNIEVVSEYFKVDPENAMHWWLHYLTELSFKDNIITFTILMNPKDASIYQELIKEYIIDGFINKNKNLLSILKNNQINLNINAYSGVNESEYIKTIPDDILDMLKREYTKNKYYLNNHEPILINNIGMAYNQQQAIQKAIAKDGITEKQINDFIDIPSLLSVTLNSKSFSKEGYSILNIVASSVSPVNWLEFALDGPKGNIHGGGSCVHFDKTSINTWEYQIPYKINEFMPSGEYIYSKVRVKNESQEYSNVWPSSLIPTSTLKSISSKSSLPYLVFKYFGYFS